MNEATAPFWNLSLFLSYMSLNLIVEQKKSMDVGCDHNSSNNNRSESAMTADFRTQTHIQEVTQAARALLGNLQYRIAPLHHKRRN